MKEFPKKLHVKNLHSFSNVRLDRIKAYFRKYIYELMISQDFIKGISRCIDLTDLINAFPTFHISNNECQQLLSDLSKELQELGWETQFALHNTAFFIYPPDDKPRLLKHSFEEF